MIDVILNIPIIVSVLMNNIQKYHIFSMFLFMDITDEKKNIQNRLDHSLANLLINHNSFSKLKSVEPNSSSFV